MTAEGFSVPTHEIHALAKDFGAAREDLESGPYGLAGFASDVADIFFGDVASDQVVLDFESTLRDVMRGMTAVMRDMQNHLNGVAEKYECVDDSVSNICAH